MADLLARVEQRQELAVRNSIDWYIENYIQPLGTMFGFGNSTYQVAGLAQQFGNRVREVSNTLPAYMAALRACPPAYAAQMVRAFILSQVRFTFRNLPSTSTPRRKFGTKALRTLERPWPKGTTGELVNRMEWHEGLAGNSYVVRQATGFGRQAVDRLRVLRPDWCGLMYGSDLEADDPAVQIDAEILALVYQPGGFANPRGVPVAFTPDQFAHWKPLPDPENPNVGMSWITAALRDMQGDRYMTEHKLQFFKLGAHPHLVVKGITAPTLEKFNEIVDAIEEKHRGLANAYRSMFLTAGADAEVVGYDLSQLDFANVQGRGETRIAMMSRVPASILQISEGLQGSALNAGNWSAAQRTLSDTFIFPILQDLAGTLEDVVDVPMDAELWFDETDMPILREDAKVASDIASVDATTIGGLVKTGFKPKSAVAAVIGRDMNQLEYDDRFISVQLQALAKAQGAPDGEVPPNGSTPPQKQLPPGQQKSSDLLVVSPTIENVIDVSSIARALETVAASSREQAAAYRTALAALGVAIKERADPVPAPAIQMQMLENPETAAAVQVLGRAVEQLTELARAERRPGKVRRTTEYLTDEREHVTGKVETEELVDG